MPAFSTRYYGWKKQPPDFRDLKYAPSVPCAALPPSVDLLSGMGEVFDQGNLGSCGPNAVDGLIEFDQHKELLPVASSSRLFIYYNARGGTATDDGVNNRDMLKSLNQYGFCDEKVWDYNIARFAMRPPDAAYAAAVPNRIASYAAVPQTLDDMKAALASGLPWLCGFTVYESFESAAVTATGNVPMPGPSESVLGGHDVVVYGFDDATQRFNFRNSWGPGWAVRGNGTFPYAYLTNPNLAGDYWVINAIPGAAPSPPPPPPPGPSPTVAKLMLGGALPAGAILIQSGRRVIRGSLSAPLGAGTHNVS